MMNVSEKMVCDIVEALCAHYDVRERAIREKNVGDRVRMEYVYLNSKMLDAATEVVGAASAKSFILDIGRGIGYANTKIDGFGEVFYKKSKLAIRRKIAERLNLLDKTPDVIYEGKK